MDDFLQAAAGPPAADTAPGAAVAMAAEEAMPQRRPHEPAVRDFLRIKVLSMGDGHTGKSCLIKRYRNSEVEFVLPRDCFGIRPLVLHFAAYHCPILLTVVTRQIFGLLLSPCRESGWCRYKISRVSVEQMQHKMQHKMQCVEVSKSCPLKKDRRYGRTPIQVSQAVSQIVNTQSTY